MKIYRFSVFLVFMTLVTLLYVHQQVQLLKLSYKINLNESQIARVLDQNKSLIYNVTRLKSPVYLDKKFLAINKDFAIPKQWQIVKIATSGEAGQPVATAKLEKQRSGIFKIFGKPREALANIVERR